MDKKQKQSRGGDSRTLFLGAICVVLAIGAISGEMDYAAFAVLALVAGYVGNEFRKKKIESEKEKERKERERIDHLRKNSEKRMREKGENQMIEPGAAPKKKVENVNAKEIKGEEYAKIVGEAMRRLHYDIEYRKNVILGEDAVHLTAYRANEACLIHCTNNPHSVVQSSEIAMFIRDCDSFVKRSKFWQDDIKYIFAISGAISDEAIAYIETERRKNRTPIEYKVFGVE